MRRRNRSAPETEGVRGDADQGVASTGEPCEVSGHDAEPSASSWTTTTILFWSVSVGGGALIGLIVVLGMVWARHVNG